MITTPANLATEIQSRTTRRPNWLLIATLCGAAAYLYLNLFTLHDIAFLLGGDQLYFWMGAQHLISGEHIYRDFFSFTPPGTDLLYAAFFKLFSQRIWVTNTIVLTLGVAFAWLCFSLSSRFMKDRLACLATALFLVLVYGAALNGTNHWFAVLAIAGAVNVVMGGTSSVRLAAAGSLLALAAFFNQAHGAAALLAFTLFLLWKNHPAEIVKSLASLFLGFGFVFLLLHAYFIATVGVKQLWYCQVTYVLKYPARSPYGWSLGLPVALTSKTSPKLAPYLFVYALLPVTCCLALWRCWSQRKNPSFPWERVALLALVGFLLLAEVAVALNWLRLYAVSLPGIILFVWMLAENHQFKRYAIPLVWILTLGFAARQIIAAHASHSVVAGFPAGRLATNSQNYEKLHSIAQLTQPGDLFLQAGWPGVYIPLQLQNPLYIPTVEPLYTPRAKDIESAIQQIKSKEVRYVLWTPWLDARCSPGLLCNDSLSPFRNYMHTAYTCVHVFPDGDALWQRNDEPR